MLPSEVLNNLPSAEQDSSSDSKSSVSSREIEATIPSEEHVDGKAIPNSLMDGGVVKTPL